MDENESQTAVESVESDEESENEIVEQEEIVNEEPIDVRTFLNLEEIKYFKEIFDAADEDKIGKIPARSVGVILRSLGFNPSKEELRNCLKEIDPDKKGYIDFYQFLLPIAQRLDQQPETHEDIIKAFRELDDEENEYLTTEQAYEYLTTLGEDLEDFEMELFLKMAETKGTGRIYYVDFVEKMMGITRNQLKDKKKSEKHKKNKKNKKGRKTKKEKA